jgi:uncharacterized protein (TIGR02328 family)
MRIWDYRLLPYLPDAQFKGQLRELVAIMHDWRDKGKTNHLLINRVMEYDKAHLTSYFLRYRIEFQKRYHKEISYCEEFMSFADLKYGDDFTVDFATGKIVSVRVKRDIFPGWHNTEYLRVCMANLYEKHFFGIGKSRITDEEWKVLLDGYKAITGEEYKI